MFKPQEARLEHRDICRLPGELHHQLGPTTLHYTRQQNGRTRELRSQKQKAVIAPSSANESCRDARAKLIEEIRAAGTQSSLVLLFPPFPAAAWTSPMNQVNAQASGELKRKQFSARLKPHVKDLTSAGARKVEKRVEEKGRKRGPRLPAGRSCRIHVSFARADHRADLTCYNTSHPRLACLLQLGCL